MTSDQRTGETVLFEWLPWRRRAKVRRERRERAREWQREIWEWQQRHPDELVMRAEIRADGTSDVEWKGPHP